MDYKFLWFLALVPAVVFVFAWAIVIVGRRQDEQLRRFFEEEGLPRPEEARDEW